MNCIAEAEPSTLIVPPTLLIVVLGCIVPPAVASSVPWLVSPAELTANVPPGVLALIVAWLTMANPLFPSNTALSKRWLKSS